MIQVSLSIPQKGASEEEEKGKATKDDYDILVRELMFESKATVCVFQMIWLPEKQQKYLSGHDHLQKELNWSIIVNHLKEDSKFCNNSRQLIEWKLPKKSLKRRKKDWIN